MLRGQPEPKTVCKEPCKNASAVFTGIFLCDWSVWCMGKGKDSLIEISFYCSQKVFVSIARTDERLNSTHSGVNSTACPGMWWNLFLKVPFTNEVYFYDGQRYINELNYKYKFEVGETKNVAQLFY